MSNRENKYINKDDYSLIMNNMSNSDVTKHDKPVSSKKMRLVTLTIYFILMFFFSYGIYNIIIYFKKSNNEKKTIIKLVIYILLSFSSIILFLNSIYISHIITKFIENNLLFKI